jgi:hypothetical protein
VRGLALAGLIALVFLSCVRGPIQVDKRSDKHDQITALWTQIRDWRREAHMDLDPAPQAVFQLGSRTVKEAARVCADNHPVPETCNDVCNLADAICDNAEAICNLADDLGKQDDYAQEKCANAKASCREAKQRCCTCSGGTL